jgi:patatin-like phospholipase/acyl hydrolase
MPYRILSFDGGGVRGVYTAVLLDRLSKQIPGLITDADLLAGTSTGGIIALGLASGREPNDLVALYRDNAGKIFDASWRHELADLHGLSGAEYDNTNLANILKGIFGAALLSQLKKKVLVPSFQLDNQDPQAGKRMWKPKFFHNYPGPDSDGNELAIDVALRTSAAPVYFPTYQVYVDGGVVANDPSMAALAQAIDKDTGGQALADLRLFSIGTGTNPTYITGHDLDWGIAQWAKPLVSLMIDGVMGVAEYQCTRLLGKNYFRLEPQLPKPVGMDDAAAVGDLVNQANAVNLSAAVDWLKTVYLAP